MRPIRPSTVTIAAAAASLLLFSGSAALAAPQQGGVPMPMPTAPDLELDKGFDEASRSPERLEAAEKRLAQMAKAYREAETLADSVSIEMNGPMGVQKQNVGVAFGPKGAARFDLDGQVEIVAIDGKVNLLQPSVKDKYLQVAMPLEVENPIAAMATVVPGFSLPIPHVALRYDEAFDLGSVFGMGLMQSPRLVGYRTEGDREFFLIEDDLAALLVETARNGLIENMKASFTPPGLPPGVEISMNLLFALDPSVAASSAAPIAFDAGGRTAVTSIEELEPQPVKVGDAAPGFDLKDLSGASFSLASMKGEVVVLDFWATWCGPCRRGLPKIQELADWAKDKPVKVFAVNVMEQPQGAARLDLVREFWTKEKFTFPTLIDADDSVVAEYGFTGIPATVVIGPDGVISAVHLGFSPDLGDTLRKDVESAMSSKG
jgi:thiol-disulfide isomerase/thioredoxin